MYFWVCQTRVQASTLTFPEIISKLPQIGVQGLYRGSIPAILGQFSRLSLFLLPPSVSHILVLWADAFTWHCSHALRTGIFEASKLVLINVAPTLPDIQVMVISLTVCITVVSITVQFLHLFLVSSLDAVWKSTNFET